MKIHIILSALVLIFTNNICSMNRVIPLVQSYAHSSKASLITFGLFFLKEVTTDEKYKFSYSNSMALLVTEGKFETGIMYHILSDMRKALWNTFTIKALSLALCAQRQSYAFKSIFPYVCTKIAFHLYKYVRPKEDMYRLYSVNELYECFSALIIYFVLIHK